MKRPQPPADLWDRLDALHRTENVAVSVSDDAGFTHAEYAEKYSLTNAAARGHLCRLTSTKKLIAGWATKMVSNGTKRRVRVYRFPD